MNLKLPSDDWIVCFDYNLGRMLLWRAGFRMRRRGADSLDLFLQPDEASQDRFKWKSCYVQAGEVEAGLTPVRTLVVDEGLFDGTVMPDGTISGSMGGQELLAASDVAVMLVKRLKNDPAWTPSDSGCTGRKRTDSEHWTSAMNEIAQHPEWQEALEISVVKTLRSGR